VNPDGTLMYTFVESVEASGPGYIVRLIGGLCWVAGILLMAINVYMTVRRGEGARQPIPQTA
jgi:cytochrome c oxidase cbb3-type subunit 1